jgi:hypothetical protein
LLFSVVCKIVGKFEFFTLKSLLPESNYYCSKIDGYLTLLRSESSYGVGIFVPPPGPKILEAWRMRGF